VEGTYSSLTLQIEGADGENCPLTLLWAEHYQPIAASAENRDIRKDQAELPYAPLYPGNRQDEDYFMNNSDFINDKRDDQNDCISYTGW